MSNANVHYTQISDPFLLDVVDEEWMRESLPDDGGWWTRERGRGGGETGWQSTRAQPPPTHSPLSHKKKQTTAVPLPERVTPPSEETEDLQPDPQPPQKERWADLGLNALQP